jgi:hypothetical protein
MVGQATSGHYQEKPKVGCVSRREIDESLISGIETVIPMRLNNAANNNYAPAMAIATITCFSMI